MEDWLELKQMANTQRFEADDINWDDEDDCLTLNCQLVMKVYNDREIRKILKKNGYVVIRTTGDHNIWEHTVTGDRLSLNYNKVNRMVWQRLVKEHNIDCKFQAYMFLGLVVWLRCDNEVTLF